MFDFGHGNVQMRPLRPKQRTAAELEGPVVFHLGVCCLSF